MFGWGHGTIKRGEGVPTEICMLVSGRSSVTGLTTAFEIKRYALHMKYRTLLIGAAGRERLAYLRHPLVCSAVLGRNDTRYRLLRFFLCCRFAVFGISRFPLYRKSLRVHRKKRMGRTVLVKGEGEGEGGRGGGRGEGG